MLNNLHAIPTETPGWARKKLHITESLIDHTNAVRCLLASGEVLFSGGDDNLVKVWDLSHRKECVSTLAGHTHWVTSLALDADNSKLFSGSYDCTVKRWDLTGREATQTWRGHHHPVLAIHYRDGRVFSASVDKTIRVWDATAPAGKCLDTILEHTDAVTCLALRGSHLISGSRDGFLLVFDLEANKKVTMIHAHSEWILSLRTSESTLYSGSDDNTIKVWDYRESCLNPVAVLKGHVNGVRSLAVSEIGGALFSGATDDTIKVWDVSTRRCLSTLVLPSKRLTKREDRPFHTQQQAVLSLDVWGEHLLSGLWDSSIKIWSSNGVPTEEGPPMHVPAAPHVSAGQSASG